MIQEKIKPPIEKETIAPKEPTPRVIPTPEVVIEIDGASKSFFNKAIAWWRALPKQRQLFIELTGASVAVSLTMTLIASLIARIFAKRRHAR